jgi:hypothetical protein
LIACERLRTLAFKQRKSRAAALAAFTPLSSFWAPHFHT